MSKIKKIEPVGEYVLVKFKVLKLNSGLVLPDTAKDQGEYSCLIVEAVGDKVKGFKQGDEVVAHPQSSIRLQMPARGIEDYLLIKQENILAKFKS